MGRWAWRSLVPGEGPPGGLPTASPTCSTSAPPRLPLCKSPRSLICIPTSSFPYPPALGDSSHFCFQMPSWELLLHPSNWGGAGGGGKESGGKKRKGKGENPSRQREGTIWVAGRKWHCLGLEPGWGAGSRNGHGPSGLAGAGDARPASILVYSTLAPWAGHSEARAFVSPSEKRQPHTSMLMRRYVAAPVGGLGVGDPGTRGLPSPPAELPLEPPAVTYWEPVGPRQCQGLGAGAALSPCGGPCP